LRVPQGEDKQAEQGVPLQAEQYDWLANTDEEVDEQKLEAHYSYMAKIQEVPTADSGTDSEPVEQVQNNAEYNMFANSLQHSEQSELVSNTCLVETDDSNVIPNSPDIEPKVWTDAPIIEEYESDSDDDSVSNVQEDKEKPSFAFTDSVKHVKLFRENVNETGTPNHSPKVEKQDRNGLTINGLGYAFTRKACFICGSFSHIIRDCDFHEKRMAKQAALTKSKNKDTAVKASADCNWRNKRNTWNKVFKYSSGSKCRKSVKDPLGRLKKELASQKQTALGKDISNPFMTGSLPKTKLRFVLDCVLSSTAFCLFEDHLLRFAKDKLCQTQTTLRFVSGCVLLKKTEF
nr:hypothetical protein [Tanacetum cinerariifolium]